MTSFPVLVSLFVFLSHEVHPHGFQLGSEATVAPQPVAPPSGFAIAVPWVKALGGLPSPSDLGLGIQLVHAYLGGLETCKSKEQSSTRSDAGWQMGMPPFQGAWRLNLVGLLLLAGCLCASIWHMMPRLGGSGSGGGDFAYRIPAAWTPENGQNYSFWAWVLQPTQHVAAIVMRLGGVVLVVVVVVEYLSS